jgi:hypothetical protein
MIRSFIKDDISIIIFTGRNQIWTIYRYNLSLVHCRDYLLLDQRSGVAIVIWTSVFSAFLKQDSYKLDTHRISSPEYNGNYEESVQTSSSSASSLR